MNKLDKSSEFDSYEIEEPSDEDRAMSSSDDELDVLLNGTTEQKKKLIREYLTGESESSSGDEFEKEMEAELNSTMKTMEGTWAPMAAAETSAPAGEGGTDLPNSGMYDKVYFDSDDEDEDTPSSSTGRKQKQRIIPTNDELLYDPDEDDRNQAWVDARRREYTGTKRSNSLWPEDLPSSDAVLNCPACMSLLCMDCQRHELYRSQYRAMFVMNCTVNTEQILRHKSQQDGKRKRKRKKRIPPSEWDPKAAPEPEGLEPDEIYHPVECDECSTQVAVYDKDEVYHFFNIVASHY